MLQNKVRTRWAIEYEVGQLKSDFAKMDCQLMHVFRESKQCADELANMGCWSRQSICFSKFDDTPRKLRGFCNIHKVDIPNIRCKRIV